MDVLNNIFTTNTTRQPTGTITRAGVGSLPQQENTLYEKKIPYLPAFFRFHYEAPLWPITAAVEHGGIDNVRQVNLLSVKITGLDPTLDVIGLRFMTPSSNNLKIKNLTNVMSNPDDTYYVPGNAASILVNFSQPIVLCVSKSGFNLTSLSIALMDLNGNRVAFTDCYIWLYIETINWQ